MLRAMSTAQLTALLALVLARPVPASGSAGLAVAAESSAEWVGLKRLAGSRDAPAGTGFRIRYRLIFGRHRAGGGVRRPGEADHRDRVTSMESTSWRPHGTSTGTLVFDFLDATNLRSPAVSHLVRLTLRWLDPDHLSREEVYAANGEEEASTLLLQRTR